MGQNQAKFKFPAFGLIRNLKTLQEIPLCTVSQIHEAFAYFQETSYTNQLSLSQAAFEDIFSALFQDPSAHFPTFQRFGQSCSTMEIFLLLILFCDASLTQKLRLICDIHPELRNSVRLDALQLVIYRVLSSMPFLFKMEVPSREEVYSFVEISVRQYQERVHLSAQEQEFSENGPESPTAISGSNAISNTLDFKNLWQWCQDVHQVSTYLDAIQSICQNITNRVDKSFKGRSWIARNSFFSTSQTGMFGSLATVLSDWSAMEETMEKVMINRIPMWKYTVHEISQVNSDIWLEDGPTLSADTRLFTAWEHLVLSQQVVLPVFRSHHPAPVLSNGTAAQSDVRSVQFPGSSRLQPHSSSGPSPYGILTKANSSKNFNFSSPRGASESFAFPAAASSSIPILWSTFDRMMMLSYILQSCPEGVFQNLRADEEQRRSKRLSYDFNLAGAVGSSIALEEGDEKSGEDADLMNKTEDKELYAVKSPRIFDFGGDDVGAILDNDNDEEGEEDATLQQLLKKQTSRHNDEGMVVEEEDNGEYDDLLSDFPLTNDTSGLRMEGLQRSASNSSVRLSLPQSFHQRKNNLMKQKQNASTKPWLLLGESLSSSSIDEMFSCLKLDILHSHHANTNGGSYTSRHRDSVLKSLNPSPSRQPSSSSMFFQRNQQQLAPYHIRQSMLYRIRHCAVSIGSTHPVPPLLASLTGTGTNAQLGSIPVLSLPSFCMKHHCYNILMAIAQGYRHVPILSVVDHTLPSMGSQHPYFTVGVGSSNHSGNAFNMLFPSKLLHMISYHEVAAFLLEYYDEFFGPGYTPGNYSSDFNRIILTEENPANFTSRAPFANGEGDDDDREERLDQFKFPVKSPNKPGSQQTKRRRTTSMTSTGSAEGQHADYDSNRSFPFARHFVSQTHGEFIGYRPLYYTNLMRKSVSVSHETNLASAWLTMCTASLDSIVITDRLDKVCGVVSVKNLDSLWWHYKQQHDANVQFNDLVTDYAKGVYHVYDSSSTSAHSLGGSSSGFAHGGIDSFTMLGGHRSKTKQPNTDNFVPMSMLSQKVSQCERIDIHTVAFDEFLAAHEQQSESMLSLWSTRLVRASQMESMQQGQSAPHRHPVHADELSVHTTNSLQSHLQQHLAQSTPIHNQSEIATERKGGNSSVGGANDSGNAKPANADSNQIPVHVSGVPTSHDKGNVGGDSGNVYTSSKPQPSPKRRPAPLLPTVGKSSQSALSPMTPASIANASFPQPPSSAPTPSGTSHVNNVNTAPIQAGPPQNSGGANTPGGIASGGRAHRNQAAHRQREKQKVQSRLRVSDF